MLFTVTAAFPAALRKLAGGGGWEDDGSLTLQDLLRVMIGATVGLLGLKLCTERGLLPFAALPLTQARHVTYTATRQEGGEGTNISDLGKDTQHNTQTPVHHCKPAPLSVCLSAASDSVTLC